MKRIVLLVLAVSLVAIPSVAAKMPPSFALWAIRWGVHSDAVIAKPQTACKPFADRDDDLKTGECVAVAYLKVYPGLFAEWSRQVAAISKPQTPKCRVAIHGYWLAASKTFKAFTIYLRAHRHTPVTQINEGTHRGPLATLNSLKDEAKSRAVRVCG